MPLWRTHRACCDVLQFSIQLHKKLQVLTFSLDNYMQHYFLYTISCPSFIVSQRSRSNSKKGVQLSIGPTLLLLLNLTLPSTRLHSRKKAGSLHSSFQGDCNCCHRSFIPCQHSNKNRKTPFRPCEAT